jgi:serine/threonine protein kinase
MPFTKQPNAEPIPGYRLIAPLGCGGFGEVWKCEAPGGLFKAIKFVYGNIYGVNSDTTQAHEELTAIQHIKDIRHPFLLSMDRVECVEGELMIVSELAEKNLHDLRLEHQSKGHRGIPRKQLLRFLAEAAEVLDLINVKHGLQHLDVKPRNLFLASNHTKVADFGMVRSVSGNGAGAKVGAVTPLYASPEVFQGMVSSSSDQYSLACCYVELLTGRLPFKGNNSRQLLLQHLNSEPNLSFLRPADRSAVARALNKDPQKRFACCEAFIRALKGPQPGSTAEIHFPERVLDKARLRQNQSSDHDAGNDAGGQALTQTPRGNGSAAGDTTRASKELPVLPTALANYRLLENQNSGLLADVWKASAPDGRLRQVKFVYGFTGVSEEVVRRLQSLQHPALSESEVAQSGPGWLVTVNDYGDQTVHERWQKCQALNLPGIPRLELISYLRTVAEVLDYLYQQHSINHLGLNPGVLLLGESGLQVADFGLAHLLWIPDGHPVAQRNVRYAPPELFDRQAHRASDQYSLAIIFHELLTGKHPFCDDDQVLASDSRSWPNPNLDALPAQDRHAIARALAADPQQRWPSCLDLVRALDESDSADVVPGQSPGDALQEVVASSEQPPLPPVFHTSEQLQQILSELISLAGGTSAAADPLALPTLSESGEELNHKFRVGLPVGTARMRVDTFRCQYQGQLLSEDEQSYMFRVPAPTSFWKLWIGKRPALEIKVSFSRPHALSATPIDVAVTIQTVFCGKQQAAELIQGLGTNLLEELRTFLLVNSEKRTKDRLLWPHPVEIRALSQEGTVGPPIMCRGKDISQGGIAFYLPHQLPTAQVLIRLSVTSTVEPLIIPATLVRAKRCADGWYDVGAIFRLTAAIAKSSQLVGSS